MKQLKALILFSGGLDSILAAKLLMEQGIKVEGIVFKSYFFNAEQAKRAAKEIGIKLRIVDFSKEHLKMVKRPKYGYGRNMNPCIDCHLLMLKMAKEVMRKEKFDFIATGEVLGERPMSQNKQALGLTEKESGLSGYLLRPLSAKLLKPSKIEKKGLVDREKLLDIRGRSRKRQLELAKKWKLKEYPTPAGGCLLTDPEFSNRLEKLLEIFPEANGDDTELLKFGRHFWQDKVKIVVGREHKENLAIQKMKQKGDILLELKDLTGPTTLIRAYSGKISKAAFESKSKAAFEKAKELTKFYSTKARNKKQVEYYVF